MATVAHGFGGQITLVHAFGAVLARRPAVLVDALGLALAAADAGAASPQGRGAHRGSHGWRRRLLDEVVVDVEGGGEGGRRDLGPRLRRMRPVGGKRKIRKTNRLEPAVIRSCAEAKRRQDFGSRTSSDKVKQTTMEGRKTRHRAGRRCGWWMDRSERGKEEDGQDGRGRDGVKRVRAELGTSGSEGREAAAALEGKEPGGHSRAGGSADGAGVQRRWTWAKVETSGSHHQEPAPPSFPQQCPQSIVAGARSASCTRRWGETRDSEPSGSAMPHKTQQRAHNSTLFERTPTATWFTISSAVRAACRPAANAVLLS